MKQFILSFSILIAISVSVQSQSDSLVRLSDLHYHSEFEEASIRNFLQHKTDTFNLFLAIDEEMTEQKAVVLKGIYSSIFEELEKKKIYDKSVNRKIKLSYSHVHGRFLKRYIDNEYFSVLFENGQYNCVTASMIFALIFNDLEIPFKVMASASHVYLVANPGSNSTVIETTNQGIERQIFTGEFKQQYVNHLRNSKLISDSEAKRKSVEEIFEEYFKEVRDAEFYNLPGFQYYNKALAHYLVNEYEEAYSLGQKAYFFYPEEQVRSLLYNSLVLHIDKCSFDSVREIDYLAQLSRFKSISNSDVSDFFKSIIYRHLQYTDKEEFCDSLHTRLISQLSDKKLIEDLSFNYYLMMSYNLQKNDKVEKYVIKALDIRGNHHDAKVIMENHFDMKLLNISDGKVLSDTINQIEERYDQECVRTFLEVHKLRAILLLADDAYKYNRPKEGAASLSEFETKCLPPIKHQYLSYQIESCYHRAAVYYFYRGYKTKARSYVDRGLKYVPNSRLLKSAVN